MCNNRFKNPYFWFGIVGIIFTAMGVKPEMLTSWEIFIQTFKGLISNPFMLGSVVLAVTGVFVDPTCKGLKDNKGKE